MTRVSSKKIDAFLVLDLSLDVLDGVGALDLEGDGLAGERLHEDLHGGIGERRRTLRAREILSPQILICVNRSEPTWSSTLWNLYELIIGRRALGNLDFARSRMYHNRNKQMLAKTGFRNSASFLKIQ